ncbi:VWA domain-containing protein [Gammaproteobacteria bacterium AS21]
MFDDFHFIRPLWLLLLPLAVLIVYLLWHKKLKSHQWLGYIEESMLSHLILGEAKARPKWLLCGLLLAWALLSFALAGPSWQKVEQQQYINQQPLVVVVDLSPSMLVEDIKPSRLIKMRFKLIDLLKARNEGLTALVVYAGDSHILAPLSDDTATLVSLVPTLSPQVMPISGSNVEEAISQSIELLTDQGFQSASIVVFTDGITEQAQSNIDSLLKDKSISLSILGVGTAQGAPIPISSDSFAKDEQGNIVLAKLNESQLRSMAAKHNGIYSALTLSNDDIEAVLAVVNSEASYYQQQEVNSSMDQWQDMGQWLLLLLLPLSLVAFRKGVLLQIMLCALLVIPVFMPQQAMAMQWQQLWQTDNQRAAKAFEQQQYREAAQTFTDQAWQGVAQYKAEDLSGAAAAFAGQKTADGWYNLANTLAKQGKLEEAIKSYDEALKLEATMQDAIDNKALVSELLKQQQEQKQRSDQDQNQDQNQDQKQSQNQDQNQDQKQSQNQDQSKNQNQDQKQSQSQDQSKNQDQNQHKDKQASDNTKQTQSSKENIDDLKQQQREQEQQALAEKNNRQNEEAATEQSAQSEISQSAALQDALDKEQLDNWLGQLPEDASRLMRNKFNYELQQKREAYRNGQWQPVEEQRW